jgi:hypothetical protein
MDHQIQRLQQESYKEHDPNPRAFRCNGAVACEPIEVQGITKTVGKGGIKYLDNHHTLLKLRVIFPDDQGKYQPNTYVYVLSSEQGHNWFKDAYKLEEMTFVMIPVQHIKMSSRT